MDPFFIHPSKHKNQFCSITVMCGRGILDGCHIMMVEGL